MQQPELSRRAQWLSTCLVLLSLSCGRSEDGDLAQAQASWTRPSVGTKSLIDGRIFLVNQSSAGPRRSLEGGATSVLSRAVDEFTKSSDIVLLATVASVQARSHGPDRLRGIHSEVSLVAVRVLKGVEPSSFWVQGGTLGTRARRLIGQATFAPNERVLLFLKRSGNGHYLPLHMTWGKWDVTACGSGDCVRNDAVPTASLPVEEAIARISRANREP
jgi:hypothetical protein